MFLLFNFLDFVMSITTQEKDAAIKTLLECLPLLKPHNNAAKQKYLDLLPKLFEHSLKDGSNGPECRALLSFCLIHPSLTSEDKDNLRKWSAPLQSLQPTMYVAPTPVQVDNSRIPQIPNAPPIGRAITSSAARYSGSFKSFFCTFTLFHAASAFLFVDV